MLIILGVGFGGNLVQGFRVCLMKSCAKFPPNRTMCSRDSIRPQPLWEVFRTPVIPHKYTPPSVKLCLLLWKLLSQNHSGSWTIDQSALHFEPITHRITKSSLSLRAVGDAQKYFGCPCCAELRGGGGARLRPASDSAAAALPPQSPQQRVSLWNQDIPCHVLVYFSDLENNTYWTWN